MSHKEIDRLKIISQLEEKKITVKTVSELMGISQRQTYRVLKKIKEEGSKGVIHKLRGKIGNRGYSMEIKEKVIKLYHKEFWDYGPTLFSENLLKYYNISVNHETLRRWLRTESITTSMRKKRTHRKHRERRSCFGELLQFDGSHHDWFEGRGAECCLINCVDDATGRVYLKFARSENTQDTLQTMWEYVLKYGIPKSIYTDRHSVYKGDTVLTDFGRAMKELKVEMIYAKSPQAKGRVERFNRTFQDRLVKELRRKGISNIAEANKFLHKEFIRSFNERFAVNLEVADTHRSVEGYDLKNIFCYKTTRQVRNDYTINLSGEYIQLLTGAAPLPVPKRNIVICEWLNGEVHIYYNNQEINFKELKKKPGKIGYKIYHPPKDHPFRRLNQKLKRDRQLRYLKAAALG
ncbi:MAG TPA: ISNCY family transposase [Ignavibacteriaceae bacterium]|nr:ISNCY family transposase [Ignavibacteriaceae bacterium]